MIEFNSSLALMIVVLFLAGFFHGMTGFGFSLVATPLLALVMSVKEASTLVLLFIVFTCSVSFYSLRHRFSWKWSWDYLVGLTLGVLIGVYAMIKVDEIVLRRVLGLVLIAISLHEIFMSSRFPATFIRKCSFPLGFMSGALAGSFNMGGPPAVVYAYSQPWSKEDVIVQLQMVFLASSVIRILFVGLSGTVNFHVGMLFLIGSLPVLLGNAFGQKLFHVLPEKKLRQIVFFALGFLGIKFMIWS